MEHPCTLPLYWLIDVKKIFATRNNNMFKIVGMNSIFIYMFFMLGGAEIFTRSLTPFTNALFSWIGPIAVGHNNQSDCMGSTVVCLLLAL